MAVDNLNGNLKMLGDLAQGDKGKFQELTSIFAKVQNTGKVTSIQLQQLALRGIPIQKTLKEMGVTGSASAEQLTEAFKKLTDEGGQFHDAMNNIIDTIEGKRGFITDTLKEIYVNFGEVTGLTDAYKTALDFVYSILEKVNNKLMEWNENPVMKALMSGLLATILTGLVTIIGVSLVSALNTIIVKLGVIATLKTVIGGAGGLIALGVAGVAGLTAGIISFTKAQDNAIAKQEELNKKLKEANGFDGVHSVSETTRNERLKIAKEDLEVYTETRKGIEEELKKLEAQLREYDSVDTTGWDENEIAIRNNMLGMNGGREAIVKSIEKKNNALEYTNKLINETNDRVNSIQTKINEIGEATSFEEVFESAYESVNKSEKELVKLEETLSKIQVYRGMNGVLGNDGEVIRVDTEQVDATIKYLKKQIEDLKIKIKIDNAEDWQKSMQKVFGFDDKTLADLVDKKLGGYDIVDSYIKKQEELYDQKSRTDSRLGINYNDRGNYIQERLNDILDIYEKLMADPSRFGIQDNNTLDKTTTRIAEELERLHDMYVFSEEDEKQWQEWLNNSRGDLEEFDNAVQHFVKKTLNDYINSLIQGTNVGSFADKMKGGADWETALSEVFFEELTNFIGGIDKIQYGLNIIHNLLEALSPVLEAVVNVVSFIGWILKPILDGLKWLLGWIFGDFNDACDDLFYAMDEEARKRKENTKDLTNEYQKLIAVMREQETYYIHKKAELNAWSLKDATSVNDMILTPHGNFSTNPNDTIIATKNPEGLGGANIKVTVNNYSDTKVDVQQRKDASGMTEMLVTISKKIASDVAGGMNGWDGALAMQQQRVSGRRV